MSNDTKPAEEQKPEPSVVENLLATVHALTETAKIQMQMILTLNGRIDELQRAQHAHWWKP